jgi:hypothetical protein
MPSNPGERVAEVWRTYQFAASRKTSDLKEAATDKDVRAILENVRSLETAAMMATEDALNANGQEVEDAYKAAVAAREDVEQAYEREKKLVERIRAVGKAAKAVANLVKRATGK